ncbi:hypothetical protein [Microlunatus aurantiacus]|uniref:hypothetical protein n=1 Tax=Microlunatus aurantiacus TaxID=446786 RepID=UPI0031D04668
MTQSKRESLPIRKTFLQSGRGKTTIPGPLATFVSAHDQRGLDAYLIVHALASAKPWNCDYPSGTYVRALDLGSDAEPASARSAVSKVMGRLEDRGLVKRSRSGRISSITLLREDGSGQPYDHPHDQGETWLQLPYSYWTKGWYKKLSLPAKALLLVALSRPDGFVLPAERGPAWYGISPDSTERGLRELANHGILDYGQGWTKNQRSETGWIEQRQYRLLGDFSAGARKALSAKSKRSRTPSDQGSAS